MVSRDWKDLMNLTFRCRFMCKNSCENVPYKTVLPIMSCSSYLDDLWDGRKLAMQLLFCWILLQVSFFSKQYALSLCIFPSIFFFIQVFCCLSCLARLTWMICKMGEKWLYKCCFVGYCYQYFFSKQDALSLCNSYLSFLSKCLVGVQEIQLYISTDTSASWKNSRFVKF